MANRASSQRGERAGIADQSARAWSRFEAASASPPRSQRSFVSGRIAWEVADLAIEGAGIGRRSKCPARQAQARGRWPGSAASRAAAQLAGGRVLPERERARPRLRRTGPPGRRRPRRAAATNMPRRPGRPRGARCAARTIEAASLGRLAGCRVGRRPTRFPDVGGLLAIGRDALARASSRSASLRLGGVLVA